MPTQAHWYSNFKYTKTETRIPYNVSLHTCMRAPQYVIIFRAGAEEKKNKKYKKKFV